MGSGENYNLYYYTIPSLNSPFGNPESYGSTLQLAQVVQSGTGLTHSFNYAASGSELTQIVFPLAGYFRYVYGSFTYAGTRTVREVQQRYLQKDPGANETVTQFIHVPGDETRLNRWKTGILDADGIGQKTYWFDYDPASEWAGYVTTLREFSSSVLKRQQDFTWTRNTATSNPYVKSVTHTLDPDTPYGEQYKDEQTLDPYGNMTETKHFGFRNLVTPVRTVTHSYLTGNPVYRDRYINNRLVSSTVTGAARLGDPVSTIALVTNTYDQYGAGLVNRVGLREHNSANYGTGFLYRGNVTRSTTPGSVTNMSYDITGMLASSDDGNGTSVTILPAANNTAPQTITPNSLANLQTTQTYTSFLRRIQRHSRMRQTRRRSTTRMPACRRRRRRMERW